MELYLNHHLGNLPPYQLDHWGAKIIIYTFIKCNMLIILALLQPNRSKNATCSKIVNFLLQTWNLKQWLHLRHKCSLRIVFKNLKFKKVKCSKHSKLLNILKLPIKLISKSFFFSRIGGRQTIYLFFAVFYFHACKATGLAGFK